MSGQVDLTTLKNDPIYRFMHIGHFLGLITDDWTLLEKHRSILPALVKKLTSATYTILTSYDYTKEALISTRDTGTGRPEDCIPMRSKLLEEYLIKIFTWGRTDEELAKIMIDLAVLHKMYVRVGLEHMCALLGKLVSVFVQEVHNCDLEVEDRIAIISAMNKLMWLQSDVFMMIYTQQSPFATPATGIAEAQSIDLSLLCSL